MSLRAALVVAVLLAAPGCKKDPEGPVCGLHSAGAPVVLKGEKRDRTLAVGARLGPSDRLRAEGPALLECFGGALRVLDDESVTVGDLTEAKVEGLTLPKYVLRGKEPVKVDALPPPMSMRYSDNRFTPESALGANEPTSADYFKAFFTPNGIEDMAGGPAPEGPRKLPPPHLRQKVARIHAGELGLAGPMLTVTDDFVFAETDDLATAVLLEDKLYDLGQTVRLVIPDGSEAKLGLDGTPVELEGPMDLRLR